MTTTIHHEPLELANGGGLWLSFSDGINWEAIAEALEWLKSLKIKL